MAVTLETITPPLSGPLTIEIKLTTNPLLAGKKRVDIEFADFGDVCHHLRHFQQCKKFEHKEALPNKKPPSLRGG